MSNLQRKIPIPTRNTSSASSSSYVVSSRSNSTNLTNASSLKHNNSTNDIKNLSSIKSNNSSIIASSNSTLTQQQITSTINKNSPDSNLIVNELSIDHMLPLSKTNSYNKLGALSRSSTSLNSTTTNTTHSLTSNASTKTNKTSFMSKKELLAKEINDTTMTSNYGSSVDLVKNIEVNLRMKLKAYSLW